MTQPAFTRLRCAGWLSLGLTAAAGLLFAPVARAAEGDEPLEETWQFHAQSTWNTQRHRAFGAQASGPNSLTAAADSMYTFSATAMPGWRPWRGGELYLNVEAASGVPFTGNLVGLGGFTNGEITRAAGTDLMLYRQRLFLRQTWQLGGEIETISSGFNQLAGRLSHDRFTLTVGNFSTLDVIDPNRYAKDPRTQFMNWSHWTYAAYDYAADARGFGWGAMGEWIRGDWALRFGRMTGPRDPNGLPVDPALAIHYGDQLEVEHNHHLGDQPGAVRLMVWRNRAVLARFEDALSWLQAHPGNYSGPDALLASRRSEQFKQGLGLNLEQALGPDTGLFLRAMQADGQTETHAFTEVDNSLSLGLSMQGSRWGRPDDGVGVALARNGLSADRRRFLAAGGISFFIGDGMLDYAPETIAESYYSVGLGHDFAVTLDWQHIRNPAFNAARGPVDVLALRLHAEL